MKPENLADQWRQLVIALLGGEALKIRKQCLSDAHNNGTAGFLGFELLNGHCSDTRALSSEFVSGAQSRVERLVYLQPAAGNNFQGASGLKGYYIRPFAHRDTSHPYGSPETGAVAVKMSQGIFLPHIAKEGTL